MQRFKQMFFNLFRRLDTRTNRVLFYFMLAFGLLLISPIILFASILSGASSMLRTQYEASSLALMESTARQVEDALQLVERFDLETLQSSAVLTRRMRSVADGAPYDALDVRELSEALPALADSSGLIRGYRLYLTAADLLLEPGRGYQRANLLYRNMLAYGALTYDQWREQLCQYRGTPCVYPAVSCLFDGRADCFVISRPFSTGSAQAVGRTLYYVDAEKVCDLFGGLLETGSERLMIFDSQGVLLTSRSTLTERDLSLYALPQGSGVTSQQVKNELAACYKGKSGWTYVLVTPRALFTRRALNSLLPMMLILSGILVATMTLGVAFLLEQRKPLGRILSLLPEPAQKPFDSLEDVELSLQSLQADREQLADLCRLKTDQMRDACLNQLLDGSLFGSRSYLEMLDAAGIHLPSGRMRGAYLFLSGHMQGDETLIASVISQCLSQCGEAVRLLTPVAPRRYVLAISGGEEAFHETAAYRLLTWLHLAIASQLSLNSVFYVGVEVATLDDFHISLESARGIMCVGSDQEQFLFVAERTAPVSYEYSDRQEEELRQLVTGGRRESVCQLMGKIYTRNFSVLSLDSQQTRLLHARLLSTLLRCAADFKYRLPAELLGDYGLMEPHEFFQTAEQHLLRLCDLALEKRARDSLRTADRMIQYLSEQFALPDMSLKLLSMQFGLTEPYISTLLHDRLGKTFTVYLEELRIDCARQFIEQQSELSLDEISARVGYLSPRTFQRAFSRAVGCSPAAYRKRILRR